MGQAVRLPSPGRQRARSIRRLLFLLQVAIKHALTGRHEILLWRPFAQHPPNPHLLSRFTHHLSRSMSKYSVLIVGMGKRGMHHATAFNANPRFQVTGIRSEE